MVTKPIHGSHDWDIVLDAALDELDEKESPDGAQAKADAALASANSYTDAAIAPLAVSADVDAAVSAVAGDLTTETSARSAADSSLSDAIDLKADESDLTSGLAGKANTSHTHAIADVTSLQSSLDAKATTVALAAEQIERKSVIATTPAISDFFDRANVTVDWASTTAGGAVPATNASVTSNRLIALTTTNPGGAIIPFGLNDEETGHISGLIYWKAAAAATPIYFGIDTGTAGHAPVSGTPDGVHVGITSAAARTNAYGTSHSYLIGQSDSPVVIGSNPTVDTTYAWSIDIGSEWISWSLRKVGSSSDLYTWNVSRKLMLQQSTPKRITGISLYLTATAGAATHQFGPVVASKSRQPARTRVVASQTIEGAEHYHVSRPRSAFGSAERWRVALPKTYDPHTPSPVVIFCHWAVTATDYTPWSDSRMQAMTKALGDAGYIFASASDGGIFADRYGAPVALENYTALYQYVRANYATSKVFLLSASGGGIAALNLLTHTGLPTPAASAFIAPASDLAAVYALDVAYANLIKASYGIASDGSDYATKTDGYDPALRSGADFRSVPTIWFTSASDTVVPTATHVTPMVSKMSPYATATVVTRSGAHLDADQFQPSDVVSFFNTYL